MTFFGLTLHEVTGIITAAVVLAGAIKVVEEIVIARAQDRRRSRLNARRGN